MDDILSFGGSLLDHAWNIIAHPLDPNSRLFLLYVASSVLLAFFVYRRVRATRSEEAKSFLQFLFPAKVWRHPSAWLDLRYFFFHQLIGHFLMLGLSAAAAAGMFQLVTGFDGFHAASDAIVVEGWRGALLAAGFMLVALIVSDFTGFYLHYLQHKIPLLWQFHKVHHSAEVMHPLSNFREHPVDNLLYNAAIGGGYGVVTGIAVQSIGYVPDMPLLLGVPVLMFLFNIAGYNLRHSHVWLRWPGKWSMIFPSPAHHQVHHSSHPDHLDKNFAFFFPIWDVIFGCYVMPEDNRDVKFGVTEKDRGGELNSCVNLYVLPFRDAWRLLKRGRKARKAPVEAPIETEIEVASG
jgi:sterol desaturase/sphingolipid hydroxylase (fatty acid hydroxylase superfamily)